MKDIIAPIPIKLLEKEIQSLSSYLVISRSKFEVFIAPSSKMNHLLQEIGRLRELTFRQIGEGTGNTMDLDEYDQHYLQLFIWDNEAHCVIGGYRIGCGDTIIKDIGPNGLYINQLFFIKSEFYTKISHAIELGRSFIISDYQKERLPLFLMWKGVMEFISKNQQYKYIYGPVSISKNYAEVSRSVMVEFIKKYIWDSNLAKLLTPKMPYKLAKLCAETESFLNTSDGTISQLDEFIGRIEISNVRLPILMKQYIKQNAKFIGFNLDPNFSDALDGFMILDISKFPTKTLELLNWESKSKE